MNTKTKLLLAACCFMSLPELAFAAAELELNRRAQIGHCKGRVGARDD